MTIKYEKSLKDFEFWGGAVEFADRLLWSEMDEIEEFFNGTGVEYTDTQINDAFWFDADFLIEEVLGLDPEKFWTERG